MAVSKEKKAEILANLKEISKVPTLVFVNFKGVNVLKLSEIRKKLRAEKVKYTVAKKTLTRKALAETSIAGEMPALEGELGIAYMESGNDDITSPARGVYGFQKELQGAFNIIGGVFDGKYKSKEEMLAIAEIPSMQTLRAQFVNLINSPIQGLAIALDAIAQKKS